MKINEFRRLNKFIDLRDLSIDTIVSRMTSPIDTTINNYKIVYNEEV